MVAGRERDSCLNRSVFNEKSQGNVLKWSYRRGGCLFQVLTSAGFTVLMFWSGGLIYIYSAKIIIATIVPSS